jgi:SynChlorMet cassette protein ScmC
VSQIHEDSVYRLSLGNGQSWQIYPVDGAESWVESFASILRLKRTTSETFPKLIFTGKDSGRVISPELPESFDRTIREKFPRVGWEFQEKNSVKVWTHVSLPDVFFELKGVSDHSINALHIIHALIPVVRHAQNSGGLLLNADLFDHEGKAALLSGIGKKEEINLMEQMPSSWKVLCERETLVIPNRENSYLAHPFPSWQQLLRADNKIMIEIEQSVPISALVFLERSKRDKIGLLEENEAANLILESSLNLQDQRFSDETHETEERLSSRIMKNASLLSKVISCYRLHVSHPAKLWDRMEEILS